MYNKVILVGNLGGDPELRYTPSGQAVTNLSVATNEKWTDQQGERQERTIWWRVAVWGKQAETCSQYLKRGSRVLVEGAMKADESGNPRTFTRQDGTVGASFELTGFQVRFLSTRAESDAMASDAGSATEFDSPPPVEEDQIPF